MWITDCKTFGFEFQKILRVRLETVSAIGTLERMLNANQEGIATFSLNFFNEDYLEYISRSFAQTQLPPFKEFASHLQEMSGIV